MVVQKRTGSRFHGRLGCLFSFFRRISKDRSKHDYILMLLWHLFDTIVWGVGCVLMSRSMVYCLCFWGQTKVKVQ